MTSVIVFQLQVFCYDNHDFVFEAMGYKWLYIHLCDGDDNLASCYMAAFSDKKSIIKKNNENMIF